MPSSIIFHDHYFILTYLNKLNLNEVRIAHDTLVGDYRLDNCDFGIIDFREVKQPLFDITDYTWLSAFTSVLFAFKRRDFRFKIAFIMSSEKDEAWGWKVVETSNKYGSHLNIKVFRDFDHGINWAKL